MEVLPPNHHADYPQFEGVFGYFAGLTMTAGRGGDARLVAELTEIDASDRVVDIGCGPGTAVRTAAARGAAATGVDPSAPMLRLARLLTKKHRHRQNIHWIEAGAEALGLPDDTATVCWSLASVHHWPQLETGIEEVARVLEPGGTFLALEARCKPGATGNASHGWTDQQADSFAVMLEDGGFVDATVTYHTVYRFRRVVTVLAKAP